MLKRLSEQQKLSYHYKKSKKTIKNNKLSLFGKAIYIIDALQCDSWTMNSILELNLSHNSIYTLGQIQQFRRVEVLDLSNNKIQDPNQILKLNSLKYLHTLHIKNNPLLENNISNNVRLVLTSFQTDVLFVKSQVENKINEVINQQAIVICLQNYSQKLKLHNQIASVFKHSSVASNPSATTFAKVKKIIQDILKKNQKVRRQFVQKIQPQIFQNWNKLYKYLESECQSAKLKKKQLMSKIYLLDEELIESRTLYTQTSKIQNTYCSDESLSQDWGLPSKDHILKNTLKQTSISKRNISVSKGQIKNDSPKKLDSFVDLQQFQQQYVSSLIKINPVFNLLHSPINSLKSHQKQLLINSLLATLKDKTKQTIKLKKLEADHSVLKQEFNDLSKHLVMFSSQVKEEHYHQTNKFKALTKLYRQSESITQSLNQQLQNCKKEMYNLKQNNSILKEQIERQKLLRQQFQNQNKIELRIQKLNEDRIMTKYFKMLIKKAHHLKKLHQIRIINAVLREKQLKAQTFQDLQINMWLNKSIKKVKDSIISRRAKEFCQKINLNYIQNKRNQQMIAQKNRREKYLFFYILTNSFRDNRQIRQRQKFLRKIQQRSAKQEFIDCLKLKVDEKHELQQKTFSSKQRKYLLISTYFRLWNRHIYQQKSYLTKLQTTVKKNKKLNSMAYFRSVCQSLISINIKISAVQSFLVKIRKIKSYFNFSKSISSVLFSRAMKVSKIRTYSKYKYFQRFVQKMKDKLRKKLIEKNQNQRLLQKKQKQNRQERRLLKKFKNKVKLKLKSVIMLLNIRLKQKMLKRVLDGFEVQHQLYRNKANIFLYNLSSKFIKKLKFIQRINKLDNLTKFRMKISIQFFKKLSINGKKQQLLKIKKKGAMNAKAFYLWKINFLESRLQIECRQYTQIKEEVMKDKSLLFQQFEQKQAVILQLANKCRQLQSALYKKQLGLDKPAGLFIKDINNQQNSSSLLHEMKKKVSNSTTQTNLYLKHLPQQINKLKKIIKDQGYHFHQSKLPRTSQRLDFPSNQEATQRISYLKQKKSQFTCTFKQF